jgi:hypothetical protein
MFRLIPLRQGDFQYAFLVLRNDVATTEFLADALDVRRRALLDSSKPQMLHPPRRTAVAKESSIAVSALM